MVQLVGAARSGLGARITIGAARSESDPTNGIKPRIETSRVAR
jgi:hypothetical protein